jgi:predicted DNA-binding transcriptional regulator YafY
MTLELSSFEEIRRWILSWGTQVEVLEPKELLTSIREEAERVQSIYHKNKK